MGARNLVPCTRAIDFLHFKNRERKMTVKDRFSPEDWATLVQAPLMAAMAIVAVSPSGPFGVTREMMAAGRAIQEKRTGKAGNDLARAIAEEYSGNLAALPTLNVSGMSPKQVYKQAMDCLRRAIGILYRQNDDEQTEGFTRWLYEISVEVAHATKEGGFLGFGGQIVSEDELAALRQIAWVLGLPVVQD